ncbi:sensor domain-containing protein, partial [Streptomyces nanshensis]
MATATDTARHRPHALPAVLRAPFAGRTWRELLYVVTGLPLACLYFAFSIAALATGAGLLITFLGVPVLAAGLLGCRAAGRLERARARALLNVDVAEPEPVRALQRRGGFLPWVGALLRSGVSWRHQLYTVLHFPWALFSFVVSVVVWSLALPLVAYPAWQWVYPRHLDQPGIGWDLPDGRQWYADAPLETLEVAGAGLVLLLAAPWIVRGLTQIDRLLIPALLGPSRLATRVRELESGRGSVADTAAADLRRIER